MSSPALKSALAAALLAVSAGSALAAAYHHPWFDTKKKGGSMCYWRTYSSAFLKKHPNVKLTSIAVEWRDHLSDSEKNSKKKFGLTFNAATKSQEYQALADCKVQGGVIACGVESDGGQFTLVRSGKGVVIKTRRISVEGDFGKDLEIASMKGKPARSFTLQGGGKKSCGEILD